VVSEHQAVTGQHYPLHRNVVETVRCIADRVRGGSAQKVKNLTSTVRAAGLAIDANRHQKTASTSDITLPSHNDGARRICEIYGNDLPGALRKVSGDSTAVQRAENLRTGRSEGWSGQCQG